MEEELIEAGRLVADFPYWPTPASTIFKTDNLFGTGDVYIPDFVIPFGGEECQANPVALHNIYAKMAEEEKTVIKRMKTIKGLIVRPNTPEADQLEKGVLEGMIIYMKHLPSHTLIENNDIVIIEDSRPGC